MSVIHSRRLRVAMGMVFGGMLGMLALSCFFYVTRALAAEPTAIGEGILVADGTGMPPTMALAIVVLVPALIAMLKQLAPSLPAWSLPLLAPVIGMLTDMVAQVTTGQSVGALWAAILGTSGTGVREATVKSARKLNGA